MRRRERFDENSLPHTRHTQGLVILAGLDFPSEDRRMLNRCVNHAIEARVHTIDGLSPADVLEIVETCVFANIAPCFPGLELQLLFLRGRQFGGGKREFPICDFATRRYVNNLVQAGFAF